MVETKFKGEPAIVICTGPSLIRQAAAIRASGCRLFGMNNTFNDFALDVWLACDPAWHAQFSPISGAFDKWHWDAEICRKHGYKFIRGEWGAGMSLNPDCIHYGHASSYQVLNLAVLYGCDPIYLAGFDMTYRPGEARHYFSGLSDQPGEYPQSLRKHSPFEGRGNGDRGLIGQFETIAAQQGLPRIINATEGSALQCFPFGAIPVRGK
jgi:hypothetical protein